VEAVVGLSHAHKAVASVFPRCDHSAEMAALLGVEPKTVDDRLGELEELFGVHSRHRLLVRLIEHGLLRIGSDVLVVSLCLRAVASEEDARARLEQWLTEGGYPVVREGRLPFAIHWAVTPAPTGFTPRERDIIRALLEHDHNTEMARALGVSKKTCRRYVQDLERRFGVHSRHRLIVRLLEQGYLFVQQSL